MKNVSEHKHEQYMLMALGLAKRGEGLVEPNPMVGCVLVRDGKVLGQGFHQQFGGPHAEVNALQACDNPVGATTYVTLEPCCHTGKTGPCTQALIKAKVAEVVVATVDPFSQVAGKGIEELEVAGIKVTTGVLKAQAQELNGPYFKRLRTGMPWVIAKWAMTLDGKIATSTGSSKWISNEQSRKVVHQIRGRVDAIVVGMGTANADDPMLTARPAGARTALRVVVDAQATLSLDSQLVKTANEVPVAVAVSQLNQDSAHCDQLRDNGVEIIACDGESYSSQLQSLLKQLGTREITNVLVEGGSSVLGALNDGKLIDEVHCFIAPKLAGGRSALSAIGGSGVQLMENAEQLCNLQVAQLGDDIYLSGRCKSSDDHS